MIAAFITALLILITTIIGFILFTTFIIYCKIMTYTYINIDGDGPMDVYELP